MREQRFDLIKGVAIFLVIVGHVLTFCIREIDNAFLFKFVGEVHMPMFFFVSGWFSYRNEFMAPDLIKRFRQLIIPGIVCLSLFFLAFPHTGLATPFPNRYLSAVVSLDKMGYWFVFSLFVIMAYYWLLSFILRKIRNNKYQLVMAIIFSAAIFLTKQIKSPVADMFSIYYSGIYFIPFILGVFSRRYQPEFEKIYNNGYVCMGSFIVGCIVFYMIVYFWEFPSLVNIYDFFKPIFHICLVLVAIPVFTNWEKRAFAQGASAISRNNAVMWAYIGRNSLAIYLLHYFFLFPMTPVREILREMHVALIPTLVVASVVAAVIICVVLLVVRMLEPSPQLSALLTGKVGKSKY